ncbi:shikimate dehydrogenase [[Eubacterium] cellulosolvens]
MNRLSTGSATFTCIPRISGAAKVCAIIGDPVAHSLSPPIHNAAFRSLGMDFVYVPFRVRTGELRAAIQGIRSLGILGVNVTIPHKTRVLTLLDTIDKTALEIGAVNTIVRNDSRLSGHNTDGQAALAVLQSLAGSLSGRKTVILGAGGAARAIVYYVSKAAENIAILNRTRSKRSNMANRIMKLSGVKCRSYGLNKANLRREVDQADLLINTLPADVFARFGKMLIQKRLIRQDMLVFDVNYAPENDFLVGAKLAGARAVDGLEMLIRQAALSFSLWTRREAPIDIMREAAIQARAMW